MRSFTPHSLVVICQRRQSINRMSDATENNKRLPEKWSKYLAEERETGMDYQTGDVCSEKWRCH